MGGEDSKEGYSGGTWKKKKRSLPPFEDADVIKATRVPPRRNNRKRTIRDSDVVYRKCRKRKTTSDKKSAASHTYDKGYKKVGVVRRGRRVEKSIGRRGRREREE